MSYTLVVSAIPRAPVSELTALLAEAIATDFADRVFHARVGGGPLPESPTPTLVRRRVRLRARGTLAALSAELEKAGGAANFDWVFLDAQEVSEDLRNRLTAQAARVIYLTPDTFAPLPAAVKPDCPVHFVAQLDAAEDDYLPRLFRAGTCRLAPPIHRWTQRYHLAELSTADQEHVSRLARSFTGRTVGLALGGGGAWGYAHIGLIEGMRASGVPIDVISGVSFGSIVGALYSAGGLAALERLTAQGWAMASTVWASTLHSSALAAFVDRRTPHKWLERLPIPFLPVATNVRTGEPEAIRLGPIGRAVRASGSLPGLVTATHIGEVRYVDGGISANVPASLLPGEGTGLVVASNVVQRPGKYRAGGSRLERLMPPKVWRLAEELNPIARAKDLILSLSTLAHTGSELMSVCAHVTYQARLPQDAPWEFARGREILEHARQDVAPTVERVGHAWQALRRRRPQC